ncbi:MAG: hypothetical protein IKG21_03225 [Atopobiaceae bacterium]|nr:hypothetical protein [Atopobiaceae bacterium]
MADEQAAFAVFGAFAGFALLIGLIVFAFWILTIIAHWKMFTKAGEAGWKSLIPIYSDYVLFKLVWDVQNFWIYLGLGVAGYIFSRITVGIDPSANGFVYILWLFFNLLNIVAGIGALVWYVRAQIQTAYAYGKDIPFAIGLVLLPGIFSLILGLGSARYVGTQSRFARY